MPIMKWMLLLLLLPAGVHASDADAWQALREGHAMMLMRHANAPGIGDPPGFILERCDTQRNLDARGRAQAEAWGDRLREHGILKARVYSSQFCRTLETARLLNLGEVVPAPELNSFFSRRSRRSEQTRELRRFVAGLEPGLPVVLISHQVNITTLTSRFPASGEALILALPLEERVRVLASIRP
ncbi:histidine phosphatase family protein [Oceanimonas sp. CHS3-5]|uniref:histidine phosphatase family protein n=1 Tax=Oceanimonas sp. CHS3-5 TaxID=3068186 RepID=UPI00273D36B2|nr:histidine phosphatase family protein [Oceanimonas sp. CHS3-5]MDP5291980.1 histidine phosphatase family protein [Oceanimonas sp. CHS3-5]